MNDVKVCRDRNGQFTSDPLASRPTVRTCKDCGKSKPLAMFRRKPEYRWGFTFICKPCDAIRSRPAQRKYCTAHRTELRARNLLYKKQAKPRDLIKMRASRIIRYYVAVGKIVKPSVCQECLQKRPVHQLEAHHNDYGKPLEVRWVCHACHMKEHRKYNSKALAQEG